MIRTQIQLAAAEYERLRDEARREQRSMADCIREGIAMYLDSRGRRRSDLASLAGTFRPLDTHDLKPHDAAWVEAARKTEGG